MSNASHRPLTKIAVHDHTERILLLVDGACDGELLAERLRDRHEVVVGDPDDDWIDFDLCIIDAATYDQVKAGLAGRKREADCFLPVLLLAPDRNRTRAAEWIGEALGDTVDDVLVVPAPKLELVARVEALVRIRRQERTLSLYRRVMDEATIGITVTDPRQPDNPLVYANDGFLDLTGYDRGEVLGQNCRFLQGPGTDEESVRKLREAIDAGDPVSVELRNYRADGEPFWNRVTVTPVRDDEGTLTHFLGFQQDVSDRVEREREARRERERFGAIARTANDAIVVVDADGTIVYASPAVERIFGYAPATVEGESLATLMPERFRERYHRGLQQYAETGEGERDGTLLRFPGLHADGHEVPLEISFGAFDDEDGDGPHLAGFIRDVSARERLESELRSETQLLERVLDTSPVGIVVIDADGTIARANETAERELGLTRSTITSRTYDAPEWEIFDENGDPIPPEELPFARVMRTGEPVENDRHGIRVDGEERWLSINAAPLTDEAEVERVVATVQNITEQMERERELEHYETVVRTSTQPIYVLDADGRFVQVNDAMVEASGYSRETLLGSHVSLIAEEDAIRQAEELLRGAHGETGDRMTFEASLVTADGRHRRYATSLAALRERGVFQGTIVIGHDITALREHQRRLSVLDRVLRHNLRNKMNLVIGYADTLAAEATEESVVAPATKIRETALDLLAVSDSARKFESVIAHQPPQLRTVDVTDHVEAVVTETRLERPDAVVSADLPETALVRADETLELAIGELVGNAVEHNDRDRPTGEVSVSVGTDTVAVRVADDGPGLNDMDRRALLRGIESPLEHTQGLGLWLVRWTVERIGGDIDIGENEPSGTAITITLPRVDE